MLRKNIQRSADALDPGDISIQVLHLHIYLVLNEDKQKPKTKPGYIMFVFHLLKSGFIFTVVGMHNLARTIAL